HLLTEILDLRSLHVYGLGLAALGSLWVLVRVAVRERARAQELLEPPWPAVDRVVLGIVVLGQLGLVAAGVVCLLVPEAGLWPTAAAAQATGQGAWILLLAVAADLLLSLWDRQPAA